MKKPSEAKARQRVVDAAVAYHQAYQDHELMWRAPLDPTKPYDEDDRPSLPNFWRPIETRQELFDAVLDLQHMQAMKVEATS